MAGMNRRGGRQKIADTDKGHIKMGLFKKLECEIRDVSPGGARIVPPEGVELPETFVMRLPQYKRPRNCVLRWQSGSEVGIEFQID